MMNKPLLTIAIPTYNRAHLLDLCLSRILDQVRSSREEIEVLVSNNASTDDTKATVMRFISLYSELQYSENEYNRGPDYNIAKCFKLARADYVWIFSDDDLLLPRAIERIVPMLKTQTLGIITLAVNFYPGRGAFDESLFPYEPLSFELYHDPYQLASEVHFWLTYITGVISNKSIVIESGMSYPSEDSFLIQLGWVIPALFSRLPSAKVETPLILGRALEVLDFKLFYVFGISYPSVLKELSRKKLLPPDAKDMLIELIIKKYFTIYISPRYNYNHGERPFFILGKSFWNRKAFWFYLIPLFIRRALYKLSSKFNSLSSSE
jgi:glycosyltransferase involved in cell wall biosynthesis